MDLPCSGAESGHIYHRYVSRNKGGKNEFPAILARLGFLARTNARMGGVSLLSFTTQTICMKPKVIRISTVPLSLHLLLQGQLKMLAETYEVLAVSSSGEELHKVAEREGVRTCAIPMEPQRKTADSPLADTQGGAVGHDGCPNMQGSHPDPHFHRTSIPFNYRLETAVINCYRQTHLCLCDLPQSGRERCEERSGTFPYHQPGIASYRKR